MEERGVDCFLKLPYLVQCLNNFVAGCSWYQGKAHLSNTPTNVCMALLNFSLFCFVLYFCSFVQYCNVKIIKYNAMHKFVGVWDNPFKEREFEIVGRKR